MKKLLFIIAPLLMLFLLSNCSKKTTPVTTTETVRPVSATVARNPKVNPVKTPVPKIITVSDSAAKKTFDGRLYYDLEGRRYWKNYKDGKYYIFNKSMANDPAFKKP